ncbi:MAG: hypothetical protein AAF600_07350 [Bacteroidota bacterium]
MEKMRYIRFKLDGSTKGEKESHVKSFIARTLSFFLPKANPDFDNLYDDVVTWILEFENPEYPNREIGLDEDEKVIVKGPYRKNLGFWIDTDMRLKDFEKYKPEVVDASLFENQWEEI